jgi:hypothetical protein
MFPAQSENKGQNNHVKHTELTETIVCSIPLITAIAFTTIISSHIDANFTKCGVAVVQAI